MERRKITLPLTRELARTLHAGDQVLLTGTIYTSRDAGHKRMCEALAKGEKIPFDPTDATIYYVGPTPAKPGEVIGSAGPTTSGRMDAYAPTMMSVGARGMIGKGARLPEVVDAMKKISIIILLQLQWNNTVQVLMTLFRPVIHILPIYRYTILTDILYT